MTSMGLILPDGRPDDTEDAGARRRARRAPADRAVPRSDAAAALSAARRVARGRGLSQARESPADRGVQGARWDQPGRPTRAGHARRRGLRGIDRQPRTVGCVRGEPVWRRGDDLCAGGRKPREGGVDAIAGRRGGRARSRLRRGARALCGGGRRDGRSLHPLGRRAAADRRRRHDHARGARARAGDRDDHRAGRRRQRRGRRLHRGQGDPPGHRSDRRAV